jgi:intein/homing endonuclease
MSMEEVFNFISNNSLDINLMNENSFISPEKNLKVYDENNKLKNITGFYNNGIKEVFDITFEDNKTYSFTGNHKLKTINGWKYVRDLTDTDEIMNL